MNPKVLIPVLLVTHAAAGGAGFLIARSLLVKDPQWVEENRKSEQLQNDLDATLAASNPRDEPAVDADGPKPAPPKDWKGGVATFAIQTFGMSRVSFTSDAPLESIVGTTTKVSGDFTVDLSDIASTKAAAVKVAVGTLKTGIDTRDEHLQGEGWFDTANHPDAIFELHSVVAASRALWPGHTVGATLKGALTIKGIPVPVEAEAAIGYHKWTPALGKYGIEGNIVRVKADFDVKLSDYGMSAGVIGKKVAEQVQVSLNLTAIEKGGKGDKGDTANP